MAGLRDASSPEDSGEEAPVLVWQSARPQAAVSLERVLRLSLGFHQETL